MTAMGHRSTFTRVLLVFVCAAAVLAWLSRSLIVAPDGAVASGFDEPQAFATLSRILAEQAPHPAGSTANRVVRDRICDELRGAGYQPEVQAAIACGPANRNPGCSAVENIVAVHAGTRGGGKAILATAHYDSVPAGPGAGDDGAGMAVIVELARFFANRQTKNDIVFLITDGEETGLRGAMAFAQGHPLMSRVGVVVNVEARGGSGPSTMFETGTGNVKLIRLFADAVERPAANSLMYEVYKRLPNDTDFSVYRALGLTGFNFAFTGSASRYHSVRDDLTLLDRRSLQHHGEHAFAVTRAMADADLDALHSDADASYFDVFGRALIVWPAWINLPLAIGACLAVIGLIVRHRSAFTWRRTLWAIAALVAGPALLFGAGWLLSFPLGRWPGVHPLDHPQPWLARTAIFAGALLVALVVAAIARGRSEMRVLLLVNWLVISAAAVAVSHWMTGAAFLLLWPAVGFAAAGWTGSIARRRSLWWAAWCGSVALAFFLLGLVPALEVVLSFTMTQYKILVLAAGVLALVPMLAGSLDDRSSPAWTAAAVAAMVALAAASLAARAPAYSAEHPRGLNLTYLDDGGGQPAWQVTFNGPPDEAFLRAVGFPARDEARAVHGQNVTGRFKAAVDGRLQAPELVVSGATRQGGTTVLRGVVRSARAGYALGIVIPAGSGIRSMRVNGQELIDPARLARHEPISLRFSGFASRDLPVDIVYDPAAAATLVLLERSSLVDAPESRALSAARPANAAPFQNGDSSVVYTTIDLAATSGPAGARPARD